MSLKLKLLFFLNALFFLLTPLLAQNSKLTQAFKEFRLGSYGEALQTLKQVQGPERLLSTRFYLEGLCQNRLQNYDLSLEAFQKALKLGNSSKDIHYEYGQALYANNELELAYESFEKSQKAGYKRGHSLYYMGHISQLLEEYGKAQKAYEDLLKVVKEGGEKSLLQIAHFQLGEVLLSMAQPRGKAHTAEVVRQQVLPNLDKAIANNPKSSLAQNITKRIATLKRRYHLDPNVMLNGRTLPSKRWSLGLYQDMSYDDNINTTGGSSSRETFLFNTTMEGAYIFSFKNRFVLTPYLKIRSTKHSDQQNLEVYENDSFSTNLKLQNSFEHTLFSRPASFLFEWSGNHVKKSQESKSNLAQTWTFGEKFQFFSFGKTTVKFKYQNSPSIDPTENKKTTTFSLDQIRITPSGKLWIFFVQVDFNDTYNNPSSSNNSYLIRTDYLDFDFFSQYTLNLAMTLSFLDTKEQKETRGTEKSYTPSIKLTKDIDDNLAASLAYEYTKNTSLDKTTYQYDKQVINFEVNYSF